MLAEIERVEGNHGRDRGKCPPKGEEEIMRRGKKHDEGVRGANGANDKNIYIWKSLRRGVRR